MMRRRKGEIHNENSILLKSTGMHERLGIMTLSAILKKAGHSVRLLLTEGLTMEQCIIDIKKHEPSILA